MTNFLWQLPKGMLEIRQHKMAKFSRKHVTWTAWSIQITSPRKASRRGFRRRTWKKQDRINGGESKWSSIEMMWIRMKHIMHIIWLIWLCQCIDLIYHHMRKQIFPQFHINFISPNKSESVDESTQSANHISRRFKTQSTQRLLKVQKS